MAYFPPCIDAAGLHLPTYEDRLEALCAAYRSVFGADAVLEPSVPDYQLLSVFARALDDVSALVLQAYNARNPAYARGRALDLLLPQAGITRRPATFSRVTLTFTLSGAASVPAGTVVSDTSGRLWETTEAVSAPAAGTADASAACRQSGAIYAAPGTVTSLVSPVAGVLSVTNGAASSVGAEQESDAEARARMTAALAGRGAPVRESLLAALRALPYVRSAALYVNDSAETDSRGIPAHAVAAVVYMGMPDAIAQTIFDGKAPGISAFGMTSGTAVDGFGHTCSVAFSRPVTRLVYPSIRIRRLEGYDDSVEALIRQAVLAWIKARPIGEAINVPHLYGVCYGAVGSLASTLVLTSVSLSTSGAGAATYTDLMPLEWNQNVDCSASSISISVT